ncbi:BQ5605_C008g05301 [Microbotryum silenes-dioicae]|uniref:BQ5605_C008g05301 protein n=1 Tax=Microbotryum silenes-dioicae TaxID=796604 RepID=A0A2X0MHD8_9BASI|nr:BQ5605_C008g05301 [Microbotryum silenes-dioicae]
MSANNESRWWWYFYSHACGQEQPIIRAPEPTCSVCRDSFVEEVEEDSNDDPRDFGYPEAPGTAVNDGPSGFFEAAAAAGQGGAGGAAGAGGVPALRIITQGPDGQARVIQFGGSGTGGNAQGVNAPGGGVMGLLRAFGAAIGAAQGRPNPEPAQPGGAEAQAHDGGAGAAGRAAAQRRRREQEGHDPGDPDDDDLPYGGQRHGGDAQRPRAEGDEIPLRNLAIDAHSAFLGEAFGAPPVDPADDPHNNPFAEGGHNEDDENNNGNTQGGNGAAQQGRGGESGEGSPFDYFIQMLNAFGGGAAVPLASNPRDYAWGEESFQNLLNDLMAHASGRVGPQPAPKEMIDELPRVTVSQAMIDDPTSHFQDCTICQDPASVGDRFLVLQCKHAFHDECLVPWLEQSGTCPTCRFQLVPQPVNGVLPDAAADGAATGNQARTTAAASASNTRTEAEANGSCSGGSNASDGEDTSGLPGSWPDVERSRSASRAAGRARAAEEERQSLPIDDLD